MSYIAGIAGKQGSRGRRALGLFVAVWLNLALAPCAMAYEAQSDDDCPHCPPIDAQSHHGMHTGSEATMPCADGLSDCSLDDDFSHDARTGQATAKDAGPDGPDAMALDTTSARLAIRAEWGLGPPPAGPGHDIVRPLHLLHCVFLD